MRRIRYLAQSALLAALACAGLAPAAEQTKESFETEYTVKIKLQYLLFLPEGYAQSDQRWPMIVFLHGAGERGANLDAVKTHGPPKIVETRKDFPFIVLSPQCPAGKWWEAEPLTKLIDSVASNHRVDPDRIYLTGLSMGGFGTWDLATKHPHRFAAIAPICGGGEPAGARRIAHLPAWVFHGAEDRVVPLKRSQEMVDALKAAGNEVKFTVYPTAGHDSWTETYDNPELYKWFLAQRRKPEPGR